MNILLMIGNLAIVMLGIYVGFTIGYNAARNEIIKLATKGGVDSRVINVLLWPPKPKIGH